MLLIFFCLSAKSQDSLSRAKFGMEISLARTKFNFECIYPSFVFAKGKHLVFAGPGIYYVSPDQMTPFAGVQAGYQFFPNGKAKRFNSFFEFDFNFMKGTLRDKYSINFNYPYGGVSDRATDFVSIDNYLSFGFSLRMMKYFYLKPVFGLGVGLYKEDYTYHFYNNQVLSGQGNLAFRYPLGLNSIAKLTFGCNLVSLRKKK